MAQSTRARSTSSYVYGTKPFKHQREANRRSRDMPAFALLMEQGTGKTKAQIDEACDLYERGHIDALIVLAPNEGDVPDNWIDQLAIHVPKRIKYTAVRASADAKIHAKERDALALILRPGNLGMRVISVNIEAARPGKLFVKLLKFCREFRVLLAVDESTRIKSWSAAQTKATIKLGMNAPYRRIMTGTLSPNGPFDVFPQFYFLDPSILGFDVYSAYKAHYCQMLPPTHGLVKWTAEKMALKIRDPNKRKTYIEKMAAIIQMPARDAEGQIVYKNTEELEAKIKPYSFRVLKEDCLDLPPKLYVKRHIELTPQQRLIYDTVKKDVVADFVDKKVLHTMTVGMAITRLLRLQQITCNHFSPDPDPDTQRTVRRIEAWKETKSGPHKGISTDNPRMIDLLAWIDEARPGVRGIVWCRHHPEITEITEILRAKFGHDKVVELHGKIKGDERREARKSFQDLTSKTQFMVAQVRSGIGIDLYEASWEYYYSNDFSYENRIQSEDRGHRQGLKHPLTIVDVIARRTLDDHIISTLRSKKNISDTIVGDSPIQWI